MEGIQDLVMLLMSGLMERECLFLLKNFARKRMLEVIVVARELFVMSRAMWTWRKKNGKRFKEF